MDGITKTQIDAAIYAYSLAADSYVESISNLTVNQKSLSKVDFSAIQTEIKNNKGVDESVIIKSSLEESLSAQMIEMSKAYENFQSAVEIKSRVGSLYKLAITGRES